MSVSILKIITYAIKLVLRIDPILKQTVPRIIQSHRVVIGFMFSNSNKLSKANVDLEFQPTRLNSIRRYQSLLVGMND